VAVKRITPFATAVRVAPATAGGGGPCWRSVRGPFRRRRGLRRHRDWSVGADMVAASGQVIFGNENGPFPQLHGYAIFGVHTSYQIGKQLQVYGLIQNIFRSALLHCWRSVRHQFIP
jgi:hypothetical protein